MATILIVDDSTLQRAIVRSHLEEAGHKIREANNGQEALDTLEGFTPDCMVLDLLMPVVGGIEVLRILREKGSDLPIVVATADVQTSTRKEIESLGVVKMINKPIDGDALRASVAEALQAPSERSG